MKMLEKLFIFLINLISLTWRYSISGDEILSPSVIAFWHGRMLPVWKYFSKTPAYAIVSKSKDGEILSKLLQKWNFTIARGSSSSGGREALEQLIDYACKSYTLITPDGPRGPLHKFKAGAVIASIKAQVPLILCKVKIDKKFQFKKSWDKFELPLPFSKISINFIFIQAIALDSDRETIDKHIKYCENLLNQN